MAELPPHPLTNKHIVVAGAGMAGLSFVVSMHKLWPSISSTAPPRITLYERDPEAVPKNREGYSLSIRSDTPSAGIQTLQKMGLLDLMIERGVGASGGAPTGDSKEEGGFCLWRVVPSEPTQEKQDDSEKTWARVLKVASKTLPNCPVSSLRIARAELRRTLVEAVEALPDVKIIWNSTITSVAPSSPSSPTSQVSIALAAGPTDTADILLAADGSASKLRALLRPSDILHFAGPTCIYALAPIRDLHPSGRSSEFGSVISGTGPALFLAPVNAEKMLWSLSWHVESPPLPLRAPLSAADSARLFAQAQREGVKAFGKRFERVLESTEGGSITQFNAMDKPAFAHVPGYITASSTPSSSSLSTLENKVIFLGDANHAVSPFAGNGANLALMDGWAFAESLLGTKVEGDFNGYMEKVVRRYDSVAVGRARQVVKMSRFSIRVMHATGWWSSFWFVVLRVVQWLFFRRVD